MATLEDNGVVVVLLPGSRTAPTFSLKLNRTKLAFTAAAAAGTRGYKQGDL